MDGGLNTREMVCDALARIGFEFEASIARDPASALMNEPAELPGGARAIRFDMVSHPSASYYVGIAGRDVFFLTENPAAFSAMMRACGELVDRPESAIAVARAFVETTRSMQRFSRVIDEVDDIEWAPGAAGRRHEEDTLIDGLRRVVRAPSAEGLAAGHLVTLYVLRGSTVERRSVTVAEDGGVDERVDVVATDLPVPISR